MKKILTLAFGDFKNIRRDPIFILCCLAPILLMLVVNIGVPLLSEILKEKLEFSLNEYYPAINAFFVMICGMMFGFVTGFMILEERDEGIVEYISITPVSRNGYLCFRLLGPAFFSFLFTFIFLKVNVLIDFHFVKTVPIAIMVALQAPMSALFIAIFSKNKVEGLAIGKIMGLFFIFPLICFFTESNLRFIGGVVPTLWIGESFKALYITGKWFFTISGIGLLIHFVVFYLMLKRFNKIIL